MAGKRQATSDLNHDNWDQEDPEEEAGTFKQADESELKTRVIKKAKRRGLVTTDAADKPALFTGFKGFGIPTPQNASFSFNKQKSSDSVTSSQSAVPVPAQELSSNGDSNGANKSTSPKKEASRELASSSAEEQKRANSSKFLGALKRLNESMLNWLTRHTDANPYCYFTPTFKDYNTHLAELKAKYNFYDDDDDPTESAGTSKTTQPTPTTAKTSAETSVKEEVNVEEEVSTPVSQDDSSNKATGIGLDKTPAFKPLQTTTTSSTFSDSPLPIFSFGSTQKVSSEAATATAGNKSSFITSFGAKATADSVTSDSTTKAPLFSFGTKSSQPAAEEPKADTQSKPSESTTTTSASNLFSFGTKSTASTGNFTSGQLFGPLSSTTSGIPFGVKPTSQFSFGQPAAELVADDKPKVGFSFNAGKPAAESGADKPKIGFSFNTGTSAAESGADKPKIGFSFNTGKPAADGGTDKPVTASTLGFSFKTAIASAAADSGTASTSAGAGDEEYVPPKAEVEKQVTEDDAVYTKRVKLFYQKEGQYVDKGVGNLFIKPLESGKHGVLIRANTNLGNILLNIALADSIPIKRMGKNNVTIVCIANPPMEAKAKDPTAPTMLLVRVKTEEDADELCAKLVEFKSK